MICCLRPPLSARIAGADVRARALGSTKRNLAEPIANLGVECHLHDNR
jgi:hypothetical protein